MKYCGHIISKDGIKTDPEKIEKITNWPIPQKVVRAGERIRGVCRLLSLICQEVLSDSKAAERVAGKYSKEEGQG